MRKIFYIIAVIAILGGAAWFLQNNKTVDFSAENNGGKTEENIQTAPFSTTTIVQSEAFFNIKAEYPQFRDADEAFNVKISELISGKIDTFKKESSENWEARRATALPGEIVPENPAVPFDFISNWAQIQINDKYISINVTMYYFTGGAHGNEEIYTFNYDVAQKKEITISDFLGSSQENLQKLSDLAVQKVISRLETDAGQVDETMEKWVKDGASSNWENYKDFNFNSDVLFIYFQKYQVAAGAFGPVIITLPKELLLQNSIVSGYLQ